ncbi:uncharacterized protein LOC143287766 isoform X2 [Babylonia areolata]|uniref:uncharacterized protein LOC143287766 isoform X2 n=1 Tax=Babylonia areolata TaxID=304850 RepID=UPI003FD0EAA2
MSSMGAVKSRQQTGDTGWRHQTMSTFSKRKKLGLSGNQDKAKDYSALSEHSQFSTLPRTKMDANKSDHSLSWTPSQQHEVLQISGRLASNPYLPPSLVSDGVPVVQASLCDSTGHSFRYTGDQHHSSDSKKLEEELYQHLNLDTHPAVTRLHNEQNLRLEGMEQRMNKIRKNAQQEAERRKFAHLFRARTEEKVKTEKLLKEASVALQQFKKERQMKKSDKDRQPVLLNCDEPGPQNQSVSSLEARQESDKGDIIPVCIVSEKSAVCEEVKQSCSSVAEPPLMWLLQPVERFELNGVVLWLVLPFLLPVLLLLHLLRHLAPSSDSHNSKKN